MVLGDLDSYMQKEMKLDHQLPPYTKINSRWMKDLNIGHDTIKVLEENVGRKISDIPCSNILTETSPKARTLNSERNVDLLALSYFHMLLLLPLPIVYHGVKTASSTNGIGRSGQLSCKTMKLDHQLIPYSRINSKWEKTL